MHRYLHMYAHAFYRYHVPINTFGTLKICFPTEANLQVVRMYGSHRRPDFLAMTMTTLVDEVPHQGPFRQTSLRLLVSP